MNWRAALRTICVGVAALTIWMPGVCAQDADDGDEDEDGDIEIAEPQRPAWQTFLAPVLSKRPGLDFLTGGMPDRLFYFTGFDIWRHGLGGYSGFQWAPNGIRKDGFIVRSSLTNNIERYDTRTRRYVTDIARGSLMAGLSLGGNRFNIQLLGGFEAQADFLLVNGRHARPRARLGTRLAADLWWEPTASLMLQGSLSGTTIDDAISMRAAAGWRLIDRFWIGPEASRSTDYFSKQTRFGVHLTGLRIGDYEWSLAAGRINDSFQRDGVYARIGLLLRPPRPRFFEN